MTPLAWGSSGCINSWKRRVAGTRSADRPCCRHQGQGLDFGDDRRIVRRRIPDGLFTSPHLDGSKSVFHRRQPCRPKNYGLGRTAPAGRRGSRPPCGQGRSGPTFFEIVTAMALLHFREGKCRQPCWKWAWADGWTPPTSASRGLGHHQHQFRPYAATGKHPGGYRRGKGRHHQAGRAGRQRSRSGGGPQRDPTGLSKNRLRLIERETDFNFDYHAPRHLEREAACGQVIYRRSRIVHRCDSRQSAARSCPAARVF